MKPKSNPPVNVALPNTTEVKMKAIYELSVAVRELAHALNSINVRVEVSGNYIFGAKTGIDIATK